MPPNVRRGAGLRPPGLDLTLPSTLNPFADEVIEHTLDWVVEVGLIADRAEALALERERLLEAGPRLVPNASLTQASLVSDWTIFVIVVDEAFDEQELGERPALAERAISAITSPDRAATRDAALPDFTGLARALADLGRRCERMAPSDEWLQRFSRHVREHIASKAVEARERAAEHVLGVPDYVRLRRVSGAPYAYAALLELTEQIRIPAEVRASREWNGLLDAFADTFIGIQDVCSCAKELSIGDVLNLAVVLQVANGGSLQAALDAADAWVGERAQAFEDAIGALPHMCARCALDVGATEGVLDYADALALTLGGHLVWSSQDDLRGFDTRS